MQYLKSKVGDDLGKLIGVKPIYFVLNKAKILPNAELELDKIIDFMNTNPIIEIELGSHSDSRGSDEYNLKLSDKGANASAEFIKSKIKSQERISSKAYGETQLLNKCENGVKCSEEEHAINRRTKFKIVKI